jgi:hypothetical protein
MADNASAPVGYWLVSLVLLAWAVFHAYVYVALLVQSPEEYARSAETAEHAAAYAEYIANVPAWSLATAVFAAVLRLVAAFGLLFRRAFALPLFAAAALLFLVALARGFLFDNAARALSPRHIAVEIVLVVLSLYAVYFSMSARSKGYLR